MTTLGAEIADPAATLRLAQQSLTRAEAAMERYEALQATAEAQAASETAQHVGRSVDRFSEIRRGIVQGRNDAERLAAEGYRMEASHAALSAARDALSATAQTLQTDGPLAADEPLAAAAAHLEEARAHGIELPQLRAANAEQLALIEQRGLAAATLIGEGRVAFDLVDEFAESTWDDIRGNGSEAQAAADRAHEHWQRAGEQNTMEMQEFHAAAEGLSDAGEELDYVEQLIGAIKQRLADLEHARAIARDTFAEAERSIAAGWEFVRANDPDVSRAPEALLRDAEAQIAIARSAFDAERPDWLVLVAAAQAADKLADDALLGARSEAEAIAKLRTQVEKIKQLAGAEVQKVVNFVGLHGEDISRDGQQQVGVVQTSLQRAYSAFQQVEQFEDTQRRDALEQCYSAYQQVQKAATAAFAVVQSDVERLDTLRRELNDDLTQARNALTEAQTTAGRARSVLGARAKDEAAQIDVLRRRFDRIKLPIRGESRIRATIDEANEIRKAARAIVRDLEGDIRQEQQRRASDFVTGVVVGAATSNRRSNNRGWGGSSDWSGGGGGWGSGGGGGGSFGGGGGGGSFGGGGGGGGW